MAGPLLPRSVVPAHSHDYGSLPTIAAALALKVDKAGDTMSGSLIVQGGTVTARPSATNEGVTIAGRAGGASGFTATITPSSVSGLGANRTVSIADADGHIVTSSGMMTADGRIPFMTTVANANQVTSSANFIWTNASTLLTVNGSQVLGSTALLGSERLRVAGGTMGTPGATDVLLAAGKVRCGDTSLTSIQSAGGATLTGLLVTATAAQSTFDSGAASDARMEFKRNGVRQGLLSWDLANLTLEADNTASTVIDFKTKGSIVAEMGGTLSAGTFDVKYTTASTSSSTGALTVDGGVGIVGKLFTGDTAQFTSASAVDAAQYRVYSNATSTATLTGSNTHTALVGFLFASGSLATNSTNIGTIGTCQIQPSAASTGTYYGTFGSITRVGESNTHTSGATLVGAQGSITMATTATAGTVVAAIHGVRSSPAVSSSAGSGSTTTAAMYGLSVVPSLTTTSAGVTSVVTAYYGLHLGTFTLGGAGTNTITARWGVYQADTSANNAFAGSGVFGATAFLATERLRVAGGTMGTPGATDVLVAAGRVYAGDTSNASIQTAGGFTAAGNSQLNGLLLVARSSSNAGSAIQAAATWTLVGALTDAYQSAITLNPAYDQAFTATRHNYLNLATPTLTNSAAVTDACVFRFDAAAGTHKAVDAGTTKTSPGTVSAWVKVNVNGTIHYMPAYTSKTT